MASGYSARPRAYVHKITAPTKPPKIEETEEKPPQPPSAPSKSSTELTKIKGVGPKRAAQLKALQITSVEDLAQYSAKNLANKLKISSKITAKWVKQAKNLLKETSV
jgi:predicted flap endonuclease-1-like 5' DNA nuclease